MNIEIRPAENSHTQAICDLIQQEADLGHFNIGLSFNKARKEIEKAAKAHSDNPNFVTQNLQIIRKALEFQVTSSIQFSQFSMSNEDITPRPSKIWVVVDQREGAECFVGFCWLAAKDHSEKVPNEIYMLSIKKPYRRNGIARRLVRSSKILVGPAVSLHARIYPRSSYMRDLVISEGFIEAPSQEASTTHFIFSSSR